MVFDTVWPVSVSAAFKVGDSSVDKNGVVD